MPERMCVVCRARAEKSDLERIVLTVEGYVWDVRQRQPGRGAYLHAACAGSNRARGALPRALHAGADRGGRLSEVLEQVGSGVALREAT